MTMFDRWLSQQPSAATDLDSYLDELDSGVLAPRTELDPSIAAIASRIHQAGIRTAEPAGLRSRLWEDLMQSATPMDAGSLAAPLPPDSRRLRDVSSPLESPLRTTGSRSRHAFEWIAAAILILGLSGAAMFGQLRDRNSDPTPGGSLFASASGSPEPQLISCRGENSDPYYGCPGALEHVGAASFWPPELRPAEAREVQLQNWVIFPEMTFSGVAADESVTGSVADVVLSGTYVATFSVPVMISRNEFTHSPVEYLDAGATVELGRGDTVSYQLGGLIEIRNVLSTLQLEFKRAVIYTGDISRFSAVSDGITTEAQGDTTLPEAVGVGQGQITINFWYVSVETDISFPPRQWVGDAIIGPVDFPPEPGMLRGFVLVISNSKG
ncbi:hypothetical protein BH09CHL1_BH09CHL1_31360 [soil metagenome]